MSSLLDWFVENPNLDHTDDTILGALKRYGQFQTMESIVSRIMPDQDRDIDRESRRLDIAMKKRALGMDDSDTYEDSINDRTPLYAMKASHALQRIPEAGFLEASKSPLIPFLKNATRSTPRDNIPGIIGRIIRAAS
jgi:hypothetical protein